MRVCFRRSLAMKITDQSSVAADFFGSHLGDSRRDDRLRKILTVLTSRPAGKVSDVFRDPASRQAAYDFLEHDTVSATALQRAAARAVAKRCADFESVYMVLDGSSLTLTDREETKGFGSIGARSIGARGLKLLNALMLGPSGQTLGLVAQCFWARQAKVDKKAYRPLHERESGRWHDAFDSAHAALQEFAPETRAHVLADREGDASLLMQHIVKNGGDFTIRANGTRKVAVEGKRVLLLPLLKKLEPIAEHTVLVPGRDGRPARTAVLTVRAARVTLSMRDHQIHQRRNLELTAIWAREEGTSRKDRLEWLLYTTVKAESANDACDALVRYALRWRIEDFHRVLKRGGGCVEDSQLRSPTAVMKWATVHGIVASRAQRLRDAARTTPDAPASTELSGEEIEALVLLKHSEKRRTETVSAEGLTLRLAVRWIGDLGGFTATGVSKKMPGTTVITRGLERVLETVSVLRLLRASGKMR